MIIKTKCSIFQFKNIHVKFLNGNAKYAKYINAIKRYAPQWESSWENFKFIFDDHPDSPIKISFNDKDMNRSCVGLCDCRPPEFSGTMTFGFNDTTSEETMRAVILHEFGHALGLKHEHQHPDCPIVWNKDIVYEYYKKNHSWSQDMVDRNILTKLDKNDPNFKFYKYDSNSIMHYWIKEEWTVGDFAVSYNTQLSEQDKRSWNSYNFPRDLLPGRGPCIGTICGPVLPDLPNL